MRTKFAVCYLESELFFPQFCYLLDGTKVGKLRTPRCVSVTGCETQKVPNSKSVCLYSLCLDWWYLIE
jgi:hypothetical protein